MARTVLGITVLREKQGEHQKNWRKKPWNQEKERQREQTRQRNEDNKKSRRILTKAEKDFMKAGKKCPLCLCKENLEVHHPDYYDPYFGVIFCRKHHKEAHDAYELLVRIGFFHPEAVEYHAKEFGLGKRFNG